MFAYGNEEAKIEKFLFFKKDKRLHTKSYEVFKMIERSFRIARNERGRRAVSNIVFL